MYDSSKLSATSAILQRFQLPSRHFVIGVILMSVAGIVGVCIILANLHTRLATDITQQNISNVLLMEEQFNRHLFMDLDDLMTALVFDIQQNSEDTTTVSIRYKQLLSHNPMLSQIQILDHIGTVIWQSSADTDLTHTQIQTIHKQFLDSEQSSELLIYPLEVDANDEMVVVILYGFYGDDGQIQNIGLVTVSAGRWAQSFSKLTSMDAYSRYWINSDGYILTTFPYQPALVGMQLTNSQQALLSNSVSNVTESSSLFDDTATVWQSQLMDIVPLQLLIEAPDIVNHAFSDSILAIIFFISVIAIIGGIATIMLYLSQYRMLQVQADNLFHTSQDLQQQIMMRTQTEATLADNEERYRIVTELISDYAFLIKVNPDESLDATWITPSYYHLMGYTDEDIDEEFSLKTVLHPEDEEQALLDLSNVLSGQTVVSQFRARKKQGDYIWLQITRQPVWDENEKRVMSYYGVASDITAQKEVEFALRESEERYRLVTELISDYAYLTIIHEDGTRTRKWLTESFFTMTGYRPEDIGETPLPNVRTHPDDFAQVNADIERSVAGEDTVTEYRWRIKSGEYIWLRVKRRPVWDEDHQRVIQLIGAVSNITAEKEAEFALRESEERYRLVTELISDYAYLTIINEDGTGVREWLTDSFYQMPDFHSDSEPLGSVPKPEQKTHPDDVIQVEADIKRTTEGEETVSEYRWLTSSDNYIWLRVKRRPIWDDSHQRVTHIIGAVSNITAEKEAEIALRESEERYRRISSIMTDFAYEASVFPDGSMKPDWAVGGIDSVRLQTDVLTHIDQISMNIHPEDVVKVQADLRLTIKNVETLTEYRIKGEDGYRWIRSYRIPVWDDTEERVTRILGTLKEITAEKDAQQALEASQQRHRELTELMSDYAFSITIENNKISADWIVGSVESIIGVSIEAVLQDSTRLTDLLYPDDRALVYHDLNRTLAGNRTSSVYRTYHAVSKETRWLRVNRKPIWNESHTEVIRIVGGVTDITAEKEAQQALEENQQRYRELTELMSDFAFSVSVDENDTVTANWIVGSLEYITGIELETAMADIGVISSLVHADDKHLLNNDLEKNRNGEKTITEYRMIHAKSKQIRWLRVKRKPIIDPDTGHMSHALAGVTDITAEKEAAVALRQSEERYRQISELISDYVFSHKVFDDFSTEIEWEAGSTNNIANLNYTDMSQLNQNGLPSNIHPDDYLAAMEDILQTNYGQTTTSEYRVINAEDDSVRWLRVSRQPIWDEDQDRVIRVIGAVSDVTVKKSIEEALVESKERYRLVTELISDYVYSLTVLSGNRLKMDWFAGSFVDITGLHIQDYIVESPLDMIKGAHPDDYEDAAAKIEQTMTGQSTVSEYRITHSVDKKPRWLRVSRFPTLDERTGRVIRILGAVTDVTAQKFAEMALRDSEERYRMLTDLMTDYAFSIRFEEDGRFYREWLVGDFERVLGYSIPTSGYVDHSKIDAFSSFNTDTLKSDIERARDGVATTVEYQIINQQDQKPRWIRTTRQPIWNKEHTRVIRYLGAVKDITQEKEAEIVRIEAGELRQALEREKSLHALRTRFVSMVTHEFRNPLAAILSSVSILDKYNHRLTPESRREKFVRIYGQVKRMTQLLEDLLEVGELEHHALHLTLHPVDVVDLVNDLYAEYEESIGSKHHLLVKTTHDKVFISADVHIMRQALGNIISNAIKYSPPESEVVCDIILGKEDITIHITDHGVGIPESEYNELFEAFYRASNVSTQPGTGLGLLIAKQSIELHKGMITFESEIDKGTTFTVQLPRIIEKENDTSE